MVYVMWSVCVDHEASMPNRFVRLGKGCVKFCKDWVNIRITNIKSNLSKIIDLDNYKVGEAIKMFNFYSLHKTYIIEMV